MSENRYTPEFLAELRALPLWRKIQITQARIIEWYQHFDGKVFVSFSGGKDSTVLLHIARQIFPEIPAVFSDTGLEYPEIRAFVKTFEYTEIVRPSMSFNEVITTYGYPIISKEVAEAIHYARRKLYSGSESRERETIATTAWKRKMLLGNRTIPLQDERDIAERNSQERERTRCRGSQEESV